MPSCTQVVDNVGDTPLHAAASKHDKLPLQILARQDCVNLKAKNKDGNTPLHVAVPHSRKPAVDALLRAANDRQVGGGLEAHAHMCLAWHARRHGGAGLSRVPAASSFRNV